MNKQAILIMYHQDYYLLDKLLREIDSEYFDIYLHVDKKCKNFDFDKIKEIVNKSNIYFTKRLNVKWSTYSQIKCELLLLREATKRNYKYYHLISGNDLLIKSNKTIYEYFDKSDSEFIGYMKDMNEDIIDRIRYYHILNGNRRCSNKFIRKISEKIYYYVISMEKMLKINRLKNNNLIIKKGANWFSITNEFAKYVLTKEKFISKMFKYSYCADELFIQTLAFNSKFRDKVFNGYNDEHKNIFRCIDWERGEPYIFTISDYDELINSTCFFARKFSSSVSMEIIDKIYETYK